MPVAEWAACVAALPALEAEERLSRLEAAAWPWRRPAEQRRTLRRLHAAAGFGPADDSAHSLGPVDGMALRHTPRTSLDTVEQASQTTEPRVRPS